MPEVVPVHAGSKQLSFLSTNIPFFYKNNPDVTIPTYKEDYRPFCSKKAEPIREPTAAQVTHKDLRYIKEVQTETMAAYKVHPFQHLPSVSRWMKLSTNFKMPTNSGEDAFVTTNSIFQTQKSEPESKPLQQPPKLSGRPSSLQKLGHVEKLPASTHQDSYTPPDRSSGLTRRTALGPDLTIPTVKGDGHPCSYDTHYNSTFKGTPFTEGQPVVKHASVVVFGDKERIVERQTTHAASFPQPRHVYSSSVMKEHPTFHLGHTSSRSWSCTSRETFRHHQTGPVVHITKNKNFSSVPKGDTDLRRDRERMSFTTSSTSYTNMKPRKRPDTDPGLMTRSNVHFSPASLHRSYYSTSNKEDYNRPEHVDQPRPATYLPSNILSGPEQGPNLTTAQSDYVSVPSCKAAPSLSQEMTNIMFPVAAQLYCTTHTEDYTPKTTAVPRPAKNQLSTNFVMQ